MVEDHFAILKVGPWLTFAFREAVLALSAIERELLGKSYRKSQVREVLDAAMLSNPSQWRSYYHGDEDEVRRERIYSFSDRCRYYWNQPSVQEELARLLNNLRSTAIPLSLASQFLPPEYEAIRSGELQSSPEQLIQHHIRRVFEIYAGACGSNSRYALTQ
jgi:D-tagatose-1,6-bisphosphate aldolase subunit GatZ/KbaZ